MSARGPLPGLVRLRSNVVFDRRRVDLVPGDVLDRATLERGATSQQRREHMYYALCSVCDRSVMEINLHGCTTCVHAPLPDVIASAKIRNAELISRARDEEARDNELLALEREQRMSGRR